MLELKDLISISPIDGRYSEQTKELSDYFSEGSLIKYRLRVESLYFIELLEFIKHKADVSPRKKERVLGFWKILNYRELIRVKEKEAIVNDDVKALRLYFQDYLKSLNLDNLVEFTNFGLSAEDINNLSYSLMLKDSLKEIFYPKINLLVKDLLGLTGTYFFNEYENLLNLKIKAKLNPIQEVFANLEDCLAFSEDFITKLGLETNNLSMTEIEPNYSIIKIFKSLLNINNILIDLNINSDFKNIKDNLEFSNSLFEFIISKLINSRLQVAFENIGVALSYSLISYKNILISLEN